jgi:hypothetical protein
VHPVFGRERQQLHQNLRLAEPPATIIDEPTAHTDAEPAEQPDLQNPTFPRSVPSRERTPTSTAGSAGGEAS